MHKYTKVVYKYQKCNTKNTKYKCQEYKIQIPKIQNKESEDMRRKEEPGARPQFLLRGFLPLLLTSTLLQTNLIYKFTCPQNSKQIVYKSSANSI